MIGTSFRRKGCHCCPCHGPCSSARISRGPLRHFPHALATQQDQDRTGVGLLELWAGPIVFDITDHKDWKGIKTHTYTPTNPSQKELSGTDLFPCVSTWRPPISVGVHRQSGPLTHCSVANLHKLFEVLSVRYTSGETKDGGGAARVHL